VHFAYAVMDYAMYHEDAVRKYEQRDGYYNFDFTLNRLKEKFK